MNSKDFEKLKGQKEKTGNKYRLTSMSGKISSTLLESFFYELNERIEELENKVYGSQVKNKTTKAQKLLILHHLGMLDNLSELKMSNVKKAKLLSYIFETHADDIRKDLSAIHNPKSSLKTPFNYEVLAKVFKEAGLEKLEVEAEEILRKLEKLEKLG